MLNTILFSLPFLSSKLARTTRSVHAGIQKPWRSRLPQPSVVSSFCHYLSRPSFSLIRAQLTLFVLAAGFLAPLPQDGVPIHRIRAPAPPGAQYIYSGCPKYNPRPKYNPFSNFAYIGYFKKKLF
jgi:hypothetical protein